MANKGRIALGLTALGLMASATPSLAAPTPSCMLIRDAAGDASDQPNLTLPGVNEPDLDILSADVASDAKFVTTVIRVARLGTALDAAGRHNMYQFSFYLGRYGDVVTQAERSIDGEAFFFNVPNEGSGPGRVNLPATGVFDVARNEVRVTLSLPDASGRRIVRPSTTFTRLAASTWRGVGANTPVTTALLTGLDQASSTRQYRAGSPSCVQVGS